ncbi:MAG TPA: ATP-binding protein [Bacillales bacterium]|nr:ATP-binding protein [Bacillales bacterium]
MNRYAFQLNVLLLTILFFLFTAAAVIIATGSTGWMTTAIVFAAVLFFFAIGSYAVMSHFLSPLRETEQMIHELRKENFNMHAHVYGNETIARLNGQLNDLAAHLQNMKRSFETQQDQLQTLIENIGSSFLFIDVDGYVRMANQTFQSVFQLTKDDWFGKHFERLFSDESTVQLIAQAVVEETAIRDTIVLPIGIVRHHFHIYCAPIQRGYRRSEGTVVVFHDITELKKLEQMRKDFVANVSHELKTPVTSLRGFAETLLEEEAAENPEIRKKFLTIIWKESERLQALIHDLLELSKIEDEKFRLDWQWVDVNEIIEDIFLVLEEKAKKKQIGLRFDSPGEVHLDGDPYRLQQIFINIIENAINYSPEESVVSVSLDQSNGEVKVTVRDNGIGIDPEQVPRIFERFYRVDRARSRMSGGTGLGLAIVKHLTEAHGGRIEVNSVPGEGTSFSVILNERLFL